MANESKSTHEKAVAKQTINFNLKKRQSGCLLPGNELKLNSVWGNDGDQKARLGWEISFKQRRIREGEVGTRAKHTEIEPSCII